MREWLSLASLYIATLEELIETCFSSQELLKLWETMFGNLPTRNNKISIQGNVLQSYTTWASWLNATSGSLSSRGAAATRAKESWPRESRAAETSLLHSWRLCT